MDNCIRVAQQLAILGNTIAVALAEKLTIDEQNVIGNLITLVGASLLSIAATAETCTNAASSGNTTQDNQTTSSDNTTQDSQTTSSDNTTKSGQTTTYYTKQNSQTTSSGNSSKNSDATIS